VGKILGLLIGVLLGALFGALLVTLFAPVSGKELAHNLKQGWDETMSEARLAAETRRLELEADLARKRGERLPLP
jgi:gas vesicle protein